METEGKVCIDLLERGINNAIFLIEKAVNEYNRDHRTRFNEREGQLHLTAFEKGWTERILKKWGKRYFATPFWFTEFGNKK